MPDAKRGRGRPRLPDDERRIAVYLWVRTKDYDRVVQLALEQGISINRLLKRALANGFRFRDQPDAFLD